jgi:transcriptional regulator with XRE-family HTH domain
MSTNDQSPVEYRVALAEQLRRLMGDRGMSRADVATLLRCSESKAGKLVRGDVSINPLELTLLLDELGVRGEERADLEQLNQASRRHRPKTEWGVVIPDRFKKYFNTEETARRIEAYKPDLPLSLVQSEEYTRAVISTNQSLSPADVERLVRARMARQDRLTSPNPPELVLILRAATLTAPVGDVSLRVGQLRHLKMVSEYSNVELRVVPDGAPITSALYYPFTILTPTGGRPRSVYAETLTDGLLVDEPGRVEYYESAFKELLTVALSPEESASLLDSLLTATVTTAEEGSHDPMER